MNSLWKTSGLLTLLLVAATAQAGQTIRVRSGESIAEAIEEAKAGAVIEVEPGTYHEALTIDVPNVTLRGIVRGSERPVLDGQGELNDGVIASGSPFTMTGFEIRHYKGNGVTTQGVAGVMLSDLVIDDTGLYGVYPVSSRDISVTHCTITRIKDAAIYVGESRQALVAYNEVHDNVAGIEIENTVSAVVRDNLVYDNTAGILVFVLPNKVQKLGRDSHVHRNWVLNNNLPNFGDPAAIVGQLPYGIGIMVMGADNTVVQDNWVKGNDSAGIAVVRLAKEHAKKDPALEPFSDDTRIGFNHLSGNGQRPHEYIQQNFGGGGDFAWDGTGRQNCADIPDSARIAGVRLPACSGPAESNREVPGEKEPVPDEEPPGPLSKLGEYGHIVQIKGMRFTPKHIQIKAGETVTWINQDAVPHTVTSGEGTMPTRVPLDSHFLGKKGIYSHKFEEPGKFEYLCLPHVDQEPMRGATVTVAE